MNRGKDTNGVPKSAYIRLLLVWNTGWPKRRESYGHGASVVVRGRESLLHGEGRQVSQSRIVRGHAKCARLETI